MQAILCDRNGNDVVRVLAWDRGRRQVTALVHDQRSPVDCGYRVAEYSTDTTDLATPAGLLDIGIQLATADVVIGEDTEITHRGV